MKLHDRQGGTLPGVAWHNGRVSIDLPEIPLEEFRERLLESSPPQFDPARTPLLWAHYRELRRWNRRLSLVGPGDAGRVVERHYGESLWALPLLPAGPFRGLDLGSGGGFPGWVLAAARPDAEFVLVESRERKWAFLEAASRRASLSCRCLNARVGPALPGELALAAVDRVTVRAVRLDERAVRPLLDRLAHDGAFLLWCSPGSAVPDSLRESRRINLPGGEERWIVEARPERRGLVESSGGPE